ncbi:MAG: efflux RND transporter permease subunit, partial [Negativicoccus succinicivorans]|uniref:efflux RND transporter permease subunit n=1 Tax=Negativicoccus succinicivorans TaxID=620903 RepID=UPI0026EA096B
MARFFIDRPIFAIVIALVISIVGGLAMFGLPVDRYPVIAPPKVQVSAMYPGASSQVLSESVAEAIEKQIIGVDDFDSMVSSSSSIGMYSLSVQFETGTDADFASVQVQNRAAQAEAMLPDIVRQLGLNVKKSTSDMALVINLTSPNGTYDPTFLKNYFSLNYMDTLKSIPGVGNVQEFGSDYAMRVWLNPARMAQYKINASDIAAAVRMQNQEASAGSIGLNPSPETQQFQYQITVDGRLTDPQQFEEIVLRSNPDGSVVHLKDVARVELDAADYNFIARADGKPTAGIAFSLTSDANALETINAIKAELAKAQETFPDDMTYNIVIDNTDFVSASLEAVLHTFVEALILVLIIVYLFLQNWHSTLIPMIAVPVSLLGTFAAFTVLGFTINTLTLFAMVLAIGLVVDDAIVVVEAVEYEMRYNHKSPREATILAMEKVQGPVIGVAVVLIAVFVPVAFMGGIMGVLYKQFALTIAVSVGISAFVALTLTPALCAMLLTENDNLNKETFHDRFFHAFNEKFDRLVESYGNALDSFVHKLGVAIL